MAALIFWLWFRVVMLGSALKAGIYEAKGSIVIAPKSNQHRDPNHIRKPTSYIMNTLSRTEKY